MLRISQQLLVLTAALLMSTTLIAHEDDPKVLDRRVPYQGSGFRRARLGFPGATFGTLGGSMALGSNFASDGVQLLSWIPLGEMGSPASGNDCWGYTSPSGREYALAGHSDGMTVVEITNPYNATVIATLPGPQSLWRDIKIFQDKAYAVSEGGGGIQVFDLAQIDSGSVTQVGSVSSGGTSATHNVAINTETGFLYRTGGGDNGLRIYDLNASLTNPPLVATWSTRYIHDAQVVSYTTGPYAGKEIVFACSGYNGGWNSTGLDIIDVTNKSNLNVLANITYSNAAYSHQGWLSPDRQYFYLGDELDENGTLKTTTYVIDVSTLASPFQVGSFTNGNNSIGHNLYTVGDTIFEANYRSGLRVFDATNPTAPVESAWFDTYPGSDGDEFNGLWNVYPYFSSGVVIGSDLERGLFVWWVGDAPLTFAFPGGAPTLFDPAGQDVPVTITETQPGALVPGSAKLHLNDGTGWISIAMTQTGSDAFLAHFPTTPCGTPLNYYVTADSTNGGTWSSPEDAPASLYSAIAGFGQTSVSDDAMESPSGWSGGIAGDDAGTGVWTRVNPNGTASQPEDDHTTAGTNCWVTGQGSVGGSLGENDVDNGTTTLESPLYDLSGRSGARISYWRWYSNDGNAAVDDSLVVKISNGGAWLTVETLGPGHPESSGGWYQHTVQVADFVAPSATVQLRFIASDLGSGSIVEAAIDDLEVTDVDCGSCSGTTVTSYCTSTPNSTGGGALMSFNGTTSIASNDFEVTVTGGVPGAFGLFYYGPGQISAPFGDGVRCVGAGGLGIFRLNPPQVLGVLGDATRHVDYTQGPPSSGNGAIHAGDTWNFQFWYRDTPAGQSGFNLSDAISVLFCP